MFTLNIEATVSHFRIIGAVGWCLFKWKHANIIAGYKTTFLLLLLAQTAYFMFSLSVLFLMVILRKYTNTSDRNYCECKFDLHIKKLLLMLTGAWAGWKRGEVEIYFNVLHFHNIFTTCKHTKIGRRFLSETRKYISSSLWHHTVDVDKVFFRNFFDTKSSDTNFTPWNSPRNLINPSFTDSFFS